MREPVRRLHDILPPPGWLANPFNANGYKLGARLALCTWCGLRTVRPALANNELSTGTACPNCDLMPTLVRVPRQFVEQFPGDAAPE